MSAASPGVVRARRQGVAMYIAATRAPATTTPRRARRVKRAAARAEAAVCPSTGHTGEGAQPHPLSAAAP